MSSGLGANRYTVLPKAPTSVTFGRALPSNQIKEYNTLATAMADRARYEQEIVKITADIAAAQKRIAAAAVLHATDLPDVALVATLTATLKQLNEKVKKAQAALSTSATSLVAAKKTATTKGGTSAAGSGPSSTGKVAYKYHYNAPMVRDAYFSPLGVQARPGDYGDVIVDPGNYDDAKKAWKSIGGRGTIQMDRTYATTDLAASLKAKNALVDPKLYGFKFLYNPTSVSMGWGINAQVSPEYEASGLDAASPLALGLIQSTISFQLLLNRIEDFKYIDANGLRPLDEAGARGYETHVNPYPSTVTTEEIQEIYKRGTMYDLEYLFRVVMGFGAPYTSSLNGLTADRGWISNIATELHLGDGLRYRVRISDLQVTHDMFNNRMVPILSRVNVMCTRYYDSPVADQAKDKAAKAKAGLVNG